MTVAEFVKKLGSNMNRYIVFHSKYATARGNTELGMGGSHKTNEPEMDLGKATAQSSINLFGVLYLDSVSGGRAVGGPMGYHSSDL